MVMMMMMTMNSDRQSDIERGKTSHVCAAARPHMNDNNFCCARHPDQIIPLVGITKDNISLFFLIHFTFPPNAHASGLYNQRKDLLTSIKLLLLLWLSIDDAMVPKLKLVSGPQSRSRTARSGFRSLRSSNRFSTAAWRLNGRMETPAAPHLGGNLKLGLGIWKNMAIIVR